MTRREGGRSTRGGVHVTLLRGINVGGKNRLPMADLVGIFTDVGCDDVRTYIQSGNVVFRAPAALARRVPTLVTQAIESRFGLEVPVVTRTGAQLRKVAAENPFLERGAPPDKLHVAFLAKRPAAAKVAALDPGRSPPDELVVRGAEIYLHCPNGIGKTKLTNVYLDRRLTTTSTVRNWRTVLKLVELLDGS